MDTGVAVALIGVSGVVIGVISNIIVSRWQASNEARKNSGTVDTSEAAQLWEESNNLRKEYRDRAEKLEEQLKEVNAKLDEMTGKLNKLQSSNTKMSKKIEELKKVINKLRAENERLLKHRQAEGKT